MVKAKGYEMHLKYSVVGGRTRPLADYNIPTPKDLTTVADVQWERLQKLAASK